MKSSAFFLFLVKSVDAYRCISDHAERFLKDHTNELVVVDIKDNQIGSIEEEFASLVSLLLSTALLNGRLSKHFETNTGYDLDMHLYYCQFDYCFFQQYIGILPPPDCKVHARCTEQFSQDPVDQNAKLYVLPSYSFLIASLIAARTSLEEYRCPVSAASCSACCSLQYTSLSNCRFS